MICNGDLMKRVLNVLRYKVILFNDNSSTTDALTRFTRPVIARIVVRMLVVRIFVM